MKITKIEARDLPDAWFQFVYQILEPGNASKHKIDQGSYAGQYRLEFDYAIGHIIHPKTQPLIPDIPPSCGIPNPVEEAYIYGGEGYDRSYIEYIMTARKEIGESYTYGERLTKAPLIDFALASLSKNPKPPLNEIYYTEQDFWNDSKIVHRDITQLGIFDQPVLFLNQIELAIWTYKNKGHRNNQVVLQVAQPQDMILIDPPCLRSIDTRIQDGKLHFIIYFRSWDLWGGFPANLAGIQNLKEYMAAEIGVEDGEMIVESKGLHLYGYAEDLANLRCMKN